jgi:hypothetical protein
MWLVRYCGKLHPTAVSVPATITKAGLILSELELPNAEVHD